MKKNILSDIIVFFFIILFLYTGVIKLTEIHLLKEQLTSSPFLGSLAGIITWALPIGEVLLAIALFIPRLRLKALYATLGLMFLFTIYVTVILFMDNHLSCSCGGIIEELSPKEHVLFNSACVILSIIAIVVEGRLQPTKKFKWLTGATSTCLLLLVGWTLFTALTAPATVKTGMEGRLMPSFDLLLTDSSTHLNTADIPTGQAIIIIGFSPWCIHCQAETRDILNHIQLFKNTRIYWITAFPFSHMKLFCQSFKLDHYPNIAVARDQKDYFMPYFKGQGVPYTAIFDSQKRLKQVMMGQADAIKLAQAAAE